MLYCISTFELAAQCQNPQFVPVDVGEPAAFNGWRHGHEARGGHINGAVNVPWTWPALVSETTLKAICVSKGITPDKTVVLYDRSRHHLAAMTDVFYRLGHADVLTYDAGLTAWAAEASLPMAKLPRHEKLVPAVWLHQLLTGVCPEADNIQRFVVTEVGAGNAVAYRSGHIPGPICGDLKGFERAPLWNRVSDDMLASWLIRHGINQATTVVLYGRDTTAAARAAVLMMYAGVDDVRILDGGLTAWRAAGYAVETTVRHPGSMNHYRNIDNTMRAHDDIAANWRDWGITPDKRAMFYCGTGWRASETFFYTHLMGWEHIAVCDGGWLEWSLESANPTEAGEPWGRGSRVRWPYDDPVVHLHLSSPFYPATSHLTHLLPINRLRR